MHNLVHKSTRFFFKAPFHSFSFILQVTTKENFRFAGNLMIWRIVFFWTVGEPPLQNALTKKMSVGASIPKLIEVKMACEAN